MRFLRCLALIIYSGSFVSCNYDDNALQKDNPRIDNASRIAVMSAFFPEIEVLISELDNAETYSVNGIDFSVGTLQGKDVVLFLSGISVVNAIMVAQLALDRFNIQKIFFPGTVGGVDPDLNVGGVVIADRWGQYLETLFARYVNGKWTPPEDPESLGFKLAQYDNFGMMHPREISVRRADSNGEESRFWFPADQNLLDRARTATADIVLDKCLLDNSRCLHKAPKIIVGGPGNSNVSGVSGGAFIDNAEFREYTFNTFGTQVLDMESAAVAHVAYANSVPFIAISSLSDLAGGEDGENELPIFFSFATKNSAEVVKALLRTIPIVNG